MNVREKFGRSFAFPVPSRPYNNPSLPVVPTEANQPHNPGKPGREDK